MNFAWEHSTLVRVCLCFRVCDRWKDIGTIAHNKSAITVEITSRDDTIIFHMVSVVSAGGLGTYTHTPYTRFPVESSTKKRSTNTSLRRDKYSCKFNLDFL